ncbi:hypothetical protein EVAR_89149_1 [Eumeta japonica]|uniref:Uncharacterized protein n=1 Tax=Eumeta variegata TaxID=151549 RepID=A0A4C1ZS57_EUMVA|nr:hypothetical protein EVAR_89149_1 [Eumeta japonica]
MARDGIMVAVHVYGRRHAPEPPRRRQVDRAEREDAVVIFFCRVSNYMECLLKSQTCAMSTCHRSKKKNCSIKSALVTIDSH